MSLRDLTSFCTDSEEPPSSLFWTILFLAQHYDRLGQTDEALKKIDEAIEHTPTVVDIYAFRAIIYKVNATCTYLFGMKETNFNLFEY